MAGKKNDTSPNSLAADLIADLQQIEDVYINEDVKVIPTGLDLLDSILGGGIPIGKMLLFVGAPGGGKSTLVGMCGAGLHKFDPRSFFIYLDAEQSMPMSRLVNLGVDPERTILLSQPLTVEKMMEILKKVIEFKITKKLEDVPFFVAWDSETATPPAKQLESEDPAKTMGYKARLLSYIMPKIINACTKFNITFLAIGQLKDKIDINPYAPSGGDLKGLGDKTITGGNSMKYTPFQILFIKPKEELDPKVFGFHGTVSELKLIKNKLFDPHIKVDLVLNYRKGYSDFWIKQRLIQQNKGIRGTAWQSLINDVDPTTNKPRHSFHKVDIEKIYNEDEEFKKCFEELYGKYKEQIVQMGVDSDVEVSSTDAEEEEETFIDLSLTPSASNSPEKEE